MLLQVHDELVFEAPDKEVETVSTVAKSVMEKQPCRRWNSPCR
jgi:DNA polymerase I-like protein with 3'-5' exonuclease and polymerase domains